MKDNLTIKPPYPDPNLQQRLPGQNLNKAPYKALTPPTGGSLSSGGLTGLTSGDNAILTNAVTRIAQLETALKALNLIK